MKGRRISVLKDVLKLFLQSLSTRSQVSILSFGCHAKYAEIGGQRVIEMTESNAVELNRLIENFKANHGTKDILAPFKMILN